MKKTTLAALLLCSAGFWSGAALAAASCGFQNVIGVAFGLYDPLSGAANNSSGRFEVACSRPFLSGPYVPFPYSVNVSSGLHGTVTARKMSNGVDNLSYGLYQDSPRQTNLTSVSESFHFPFWGVRDGSRLFDVYGRIPAGQLVSSGTYTDTITLTLTF